MIINVETRGIDLGLPQRSLLFVYTILIPALGVVISEIYARKVNIDGYARVLSTYNTRKQSNGRACASVGDLNNGSSNAGCLSKDILCLDVSAHTRQRELLLT